MSININSVLSVSNLKFSYTSSVNVLNNISFDVKKGDYIGLVGHNGSGKTTLVKVILGLLKPSSGSVNLFGKSIDKFHSWEKIGYMPQNTSFFNPIFPATVEEVVSLGLLSTKKFPKKISHKDKIIVDESLDRLKINHLKDKLIGDLSGGQQQRVFLARALITKPEILILDEPSNALDSATREQFFSVIQELNQSHKTTIILITHDVGHIGRYANKLLYIDQKIIFYGSFSDFCQSTDMGQKFGSDSQHVICHQHE